VLYFENVLEGKMRKLTTPVLKKMPIIFWYWLIYYCSKPAEILGDTKNPGREQKLRHLDLEQSH
jgi:hypothetical protein